MGSAGFLGQADRKFAVRYEVHRLRAKARPGVARPPIVEQFLGLDRARLSALTHALDGSTHDGDRFNGIVQVFEVFHLADREIKRTLLDVLDERVSFRILNETRLPRADQLSIDVDAFQTELDLLVL